LKFESSMNALTVVSRPVTLRFRRPRGVRLSGSYSPPGLSKARASPPDISSLTC